MIVLRQVLRFTVLVAFASAGLLRAQQTKLGKSHAIDVGANYTFMRTNVLPGCNCFSLNGGGAQAQIAITPHFAAVADFTATHAGNITPDKYELTQLTYIAGARYIVLDKKRSTPFGEVMLGGAHALGSLSPGNNAIGGSSNAFALQVGGGLSVRVAERLRLVPIQTDYLLTTFNNNSANHQSDLRYSAGIIVRLSHEGHAGDPH